MKFFNEEQIRNAELVKKKKKKKKEKAPSQLYKKLPIQLLFWRSWCNKIL